MPDSSPSRRLTIVGGGPAGLMAADVARAAGIEVDLYERMGSVGRKLLIAGKGGLNLTHSEPLPAFVGRYRERADEIARWLADFGPDALRQWARGLGVDTFVGSSGRVFPTDLKAAPLLRGWVRQLRARGVRFHVDHDCIGLEAVAADHRSAPRYRLRFHHREHGVIEVETDALIVALGGASWPQLGSDGRWTGWLPRAGVEISPLRPSNCGFELDWSPVFAERFAGQPLKPVVLQLRSAQGQTLQAQQGELMVTQHGLEGGLIYAMSAPLRDVIDRDGAAPIALDLAPSRDHASLQRALSAARGKRSLTEHWRRSAGLDALRCGLLYEVLDSDARHDAARVADAIKALPLTLRRTRPIAEAISSAGGVRFDALSADEPLMLSALPGVYVAGEMLDWDAPTGGYLLTACFASGYRAAVAAVQRLQAVSA